MENDCNWHWFNQLLRQAIQQHVPAFLIPQTLTFVSDRQKGLLGGVKNNFPDSPQGYCLRHLYDNMYKEFKHPALRTFLWQAAEATTEEDFNKALNGMKGISERVVDWLLSHAPPMYWAELYFPGRRYGHITSNISESLNAALLKAREKPILGMFEYLRYKVMEWYFGRRRIDSNNLPQGQIIVSRAVQKIQELTAWQARCYRVLPATDTEYEIFSLERQINYVVKLDCMTCTCFQWQSTGIPCAHAIAVILARKEDPQTYCYAFLSLDAYRKTYESSIHPPNADEAGTKLFDNHLQSNSDSDNDQNPDDKIKSPHANRAIGRPQKRRIRSGIEGPFGSKRQKKCSRCGGLGPARTTCDASI